MKQKRVLATCAHVQAGRMAWEIASLKLCVFFQHGFSDSCHLARVVGGSATGKGAHWLTEVHTPRIVTHPRSDGLRREHGRWVSVVL